MVRRDQVAQIQADLSGLLTWKAQFEADTDVKRAYQIGVDTLSRLKNGRYGSLIAERLKRT